MDKILAFDIGGTGCQWATFDSKLKIIGKGSFSTRNKEKDHVLDLVAKVIRKHDSKDTKIAISSPTAVNLQTGYCYGISGIKNYENFNLYDELSLRVGKKYKIRATNDANASLLGNLKTSDGNTVLFTLGTGVGGAIYVNNNLLTGKNGFGGEFGYAFIHGDAENVSKHISTEALVRTIERLYHSETNGKEIWKAYMNEKRYISEVEDWVKKVSTFVSTLVFFLNPDTVIVAGGIGAEKQFVDLLTKYIQKDLDVYNVKLLMPKIRGTEKANMASLKGAANLWKK